MKENKVITDIKQLTPEWLTRILKKKGYLSMGTVRKIIRSNSREASSSNVHFLELILSDDAQTESFSSNIVVKISKSRTIKPNAKILNKHESKFYAQVGEAINGISIPICYDAAFSEKTGLSHIILEDLTMSHFEYGLSNWPIPPPKLYCEKAIDCLAEFHAFWWDHKRLRELSKHSFMFYTFKENSFKEKEILNWFENENRTLNRLLNSLGDRMSDKRKELFETVFSLYPQAAFERIKQENITLIHSDAHLLNFFFPKDIENQNSKAKLIDWEFWALGVGAYDLVYMMGLCWYPERRNLMEKDLVKRYHNNLLKRGVKNYSWDDCWHDYRFNAFLNLYRIVYWWGHDYPPNFWWDALERSFLIIEDLNCMELLEG